MPETSGTWTFTTISVDPDLNGKSGSFVADRPGSGNHDPVVDLIQRLDAALHLRRLDRVRPEAVDETLFLGQHGLLSGKGRLLVGLADGALAFVEIVVSRVRDDLARIDLRNLRD